MKPRFSIATLAILSVGTLALVGCSGSPDTAYPVTGKVTVDGTPATCGTVQFESLEEGKAFSARGTINEQGEYSLTTFEQNDGAVAGRHSVVIVPNLNLKGSEKPSWFTATYVDIPDRYTHPETPFLEFEVKPGDNVFNIELTTQEMP